MMRLGGLRHCREARHDSPGELGHQVQMHAGEIEAIERGQRLVRPDTAVRFSQVLRVGLRELIESQQERASAAYNRTLSAWDTAVSCFDSRGRHVIATLGRWEEHIETAHPDVAEQFDAVAQTITEPNAVMRDAKYAASENSYRMGALPGFPDKYPKVAVGYGASNSLGSIVAGWVVTVYPTGGFGNGEQQRWP